MKKLWLVFLFVCINLGAFAQSDGVIQEIAGTVEIKLPGSALFTEAKVGDRVSQDTVISTGFRSLANIAIGHTLITVRPLTRLTLTEVQATAGTETLNVSLQSGRVRVDVKPPAGTRSDMSINSPMATASVRGTSFEFDTRNLYVDSGTVVFAGTRGHQIQVSAGDNSRVEADARAVAPIEVKLAGVLPPSPVGSDVAGIIASGPARQSVAFTITLKFWDGK